jgi:hypothetical protein
MPQRQFKRGIRISFKLKNGLECQIEGDLTMKTSLAIVLAAAALMASVTGSAIAHPSKGLPINNPQLDVAPSPVPPGAPYRR